MPAPEIIHQLVTKFEENRAAYRSGKYNEARLRLEFLDPFFAVLGWDIYNTKGVAPQYADVIIEESLEIEGGSKSPDYTFKVGPERKFFVEAKKPAVDIQYDIHPAFQVRRYAWNAQLPLSILTDFEDFAVYNCKAKPNPSDSPATSREILIHYTDYIERWDEIAAIFSRDAVWKGALDRYAESSKGKKGTTAVDDEFLKDMNEWRLMLARNIALRNDHVKDEQQLNYAVQMTIDRVIFLRICEDRGIEPEEQLKNLSAAPGVYPRLLELFRHADLKYNSGLFNFTHDKDDNTPPDTFTPTLTIDDKVLKEFIKDIYYPCPYIFKEIPVEILGQVYEQFLGQVIRLTAGHQAKVEEKPEVRKAGGVYYTPKYIVDYIVANTVGKLLEGKTPAEAAALKIVDPACGSGSFLLGAFQYLIDWHEKWYLDNDPGKWTKGKAPALNEVTGGYHLTTLKKKEILLNNLHGVDIDAQAVEVTKLSLLLKVLEEETGQLSLGLERALPDLGRNIQCGNSLIGEDYFAGQLVIDPAERRRVNPFDWERAFPEVFKQGGFDAVIGNPPYLFITELEKVDKDFFFNKYQTSEYRFDVYGLFIEKAKSLIMRIGGYLGYIIPHTLLSNDSFEKLRRMLLRDTYIKQVVDIGPNVFRGARNETMILTLIKDNVEELTSVINTDARSFPIPIAYNEISQNKWLSNQKAVWVVNSSDICTSIVKKIEENQITLGSICTINQGLRTGDNKRLLAESDLGGKWKPVIGGKHVGRYKPLLIDNYVLYDPKILDAPRKKEIFESREKLVVQEIRNIKLARRIIATYDDKQIYCLQSTNVINLRKDGKTGFEMKLLLAIINSNLINYYFRYRFSGNNHIASNQLSEIRLPTINKANQDLLNGLASLIINLHKRTPSTPQEQDQLRREIESTDRQIDQLVYQLYGLTDEEVRIVERT